MCAGNSKYPTHGTGRKFHFWPSDSRRPRDFWPVTQYLMNIKWVLANSDEYYLGVDHAPLSHRIVGIGINVRGFRGLGMNREH